MSSAALVECSFLIPLRRDAILSDGALHDSDLWHVLDYELFNRFRGGTQHPGTFRGFYADVDTGQRVDDESFKFTVAVPSEAVDSVRQFLQALCVLFQQKCIYLSVAGHVEFIATAESSADEV